MWGTDTELAVTALFAAVAKLALRISLLRSKSRPSRLLLVPGRPIGGIFLGFLCPLLFAWMTDSGPVRWLADWKLWHLGIPRSPGLTGVQLFLLTLVVVWLLLGWLARRREAELGPERTAEMMAEAAEAAEAKKRNQDRLGVLTVVIALLIPLGVLAAVIALYVHGPLKLHPVALGIGQVLSTALFCFGAGIPVFAARAWRPAR